MKKIYYCIFLLLCSAAACKKDTTDFIATSSINIVNGTVGSAPVKVNPGAATAFAWSKTPDVVPYGSSKLYAAFPGSRNITVVSAADTTKTLFSGTVNLKQANTLYLIGTAAAVDTMFNAENNLPVINATVLNPDNSVYFRFINLSPNSSPLNIRITSATADETAGLAYRGISGFKKYAAESTTANYVFEVRDAVTGTLLLTYTIDPKIASVRYKTISLVVKGLMGTTSGADAFGITPINCF